MGIRVARRAAAGTAGVVAGALCVLGLGGAGPVAGAAPVDHPDLQVSAPADGLDFGEATLGDYVGPQTFTLSNTAAVPVTLDVVTGFTLSGPGADDFFGDPESGCDVNGDVLTLAADGGSCAIDAYFLPGALGTRSATLTMTDSTGSSTALPLTGVGGIGYYQVDATGAVAYGGDAAFWGDASTTTLNHPIVGMASTGDDGGYWLVASDGGIFNYGDADFYGSTGSIHLNEPIVGMAPTPDDGGYWLVASDGGIFNYGDAPFYGSTGGLHLNEPIVGMAATADGRGYWLVASDGGIFSYGDANFYGSTGSIHLNEPIVGMAPTPDDGGYWLVASDGGVFAYGDANFYGSTGAIHLNKPIVGMTAMPDGSGYWFSAADGGLFNFGDAPFYGSGTAIGLGQVVGMATDGEPTAQAAADRPALRAHVTGSVSLRAGPPPGARHFAGP